MKTTCRQACYDVDQTCDKKSASRLHHPCPYYDFEPLAGPTHGYSRLVGYALACSLAKNVSGREPCVPGPRFVRLALLNYSQKCRGEGARMSGRGCGCVSLFSIAGGSKSWVIV